MPNGIVKKADSYAVGIRIVGSSGQSDSSAINFKFFVSGEEHIVPKSKAGIHGSLSLEGGLP